MNRQIAADERKIALKELYSFTNRDKAAGDALADLVDKDYRVLERMNAGQIRELHAKVVSAAGGRPGAVLSNTFNMKLDPTMTNERVLEIMGQAQEKSAAAGTAGKVTMQEAGDKLDAEAQRIKAERRCSYSEAFTAARRKYPELAAIYDTGITE